MFWTGALDGAAEVVTGAAAELAVVDGGGGGACDVVEGFADGVVEGVVDGVAALMTTGAEDAELLGLAFDDGAGAGASPSSTSVPFLRPS